MGIFMLFAPLLYGVIGYVCVALFSWIYNLVAQKFGGIEIEVKSDQLTESEANITGK